MLPEVKRRRFLQVAALAGLWPAARLGAAERLGGEVMTVRGPRAAADLGFVLPHEHVLVDFIGAAEVSPARYDAAVAAARIRPFLEEAKALGCATLFECTPAGIGRESPRAGRSLPGGIFGGPSSVEAGSLNDSRATSAEFGPPIAWRLRRAMPLCVSSSTRSALVATSGQPRMALS